MKEVLNNIMNKNKILYGLSVCALLGMLCSCSSKVSEGGHQSDGTEQSQAAISGTETVADDSTDAASEKVMSEESEPTEERREKADTSELPDTKGDNYQQTNSEIEKTEASTEIKETSEKVEGKTEDENSSEETMSELTSDMACKAVEAYCREDNPSLNDMNSEEHIFYWLVEEETSTDYTILYRSYTGALSHYYVNIESGNVTLVQEEVEDTVTYNDLFNIWDYVQ